MASNRTKTLLFPFIPAAVACLAIASITLTLALRFTHGSDTSISVESQTYIIQVQHRFVSATSSSKPAANVIAVIPVTASPAPLVSTTRPRTPDDERLLYVRPPPGMIAASH
jgi:hypothetical protein